MKRRLLFTVIGLASIYPTPAHSQQLLWEQIPQIPKISKEADFKTDESIKWEAIQNHSHQTTSRTANEAQGPSLAWELLTPAPLQKQKEEINADTDIAVHSNIQSQELIWEPVDADEIIVVEDQPNTEQESVSTEQAIATAYNAIEQQSATFANDKALWRNDNWHPQISGTVPVGFGPKGLMVSGSLWAIDCVTGAGYCATPDSWEDYRDQIENSGEAQYNISVGFGDAEKLVGVTVTARSEETNLPIGDRNTYEERNILSNYYLGLHVSRSISQDTSVKFGMDNWLGVGECEDTNRCGFPKSAYGVISQRIRLNQDQNAFFPNAYLTLGAGNGQFRPFGEMVRDSIAKQRSAGCTTIGFTADEPCSEDTLYNAIQRASRYGKIYPIGSIALEAFPGMNVIGEWSGRNLNAGFSMRPFEEIGFVLTGMWENILPNCDYGCRIAVPDYPGGLDLSLLENAMTERARFSFQASLEFKF